MLLRWVAISARYKFYSLKLHEINVHPRVQLRPNMAWSTSPCHSLERRRLARCPCVPPALRDLLSIRPFPLLHFTPSGGIEAAFGTE